MKPTRFKKITEAKGTYWLMLITVALAMILCLWAASTQGQDSTSIKSKTKTEFYASINEMKHVKKKPYEDRYKFINKQKDILVISGFSFTFCFIVLIKSL